MSRFRLGVRWAKSRALTIVGDVHNRENFIWPTHNELFELNQGTLVTGRSQKKPCHRYNFNPSSWAYWRSETGHVLPSIEFEKFQALGLQCLVVPLCWGPEGEHLDESSINEIVRCWIELNILVGKNRHDLVYLDYKDFGWIRGSGVRQYNRLPIIPATRNNLRKRKLDCFGKKKAGYKCPKRQASSIATSLTEIIQFRDMTTWDDAIIRGNLASSWQSRIMGGVLGRQSLIKVLKFLPKGSRSDYDFWFHQLPS